MKVYYDEFEGGLSPVWMIVPINLIEWQLERFYISLSTPFEQFTTNDFDSNQLYLTVQIEDLIRNWNEQDSVGISLSSIRSRFESQKSNNDIDVEFICTDIEQLVIRMSDIEEVLQMNIRSYYKWEESSNERACLSTR
ncbi:hypothetical protein EHS13_13460 [Paenibacillus psychroresistens]|uniref:Uncharacterized protein n=1 Tax=Paenibacillus psychroresistens TaxID=1778678 RepID=A0A6B8RH55_9BACL|nr:hypothetical protein [Paenibacillus psychroresistens]QGQ95811.1 hypothetical protein EHS13_13460 [Paenibacillus psychroresistens]